MGEPGSNAREVGVGGEEARDDVFVLGASEGASGVDEPAPGSEVVGSAIEEFQLQRRQAGEALGLQAPRRSGPRRRAPSCEHRGVDEDVRDPEAVGGSGAVNPHDGAGARGASSQAVKSEIDVGGAAECPGLPGPRRRAASCRRRRRGNEHLIPWTHFEHGSDELAALVLHFEVAAAVRLEAIEVRSRARDQRVRAPAAGLAGNARAQASGECLLAALVFRRFTPRRIDGTLIAAASRLASATEPVSASSVWASQSGMEWRDRPRGWRRQQRDIRETEPIGRPRNGRPRRGRK